MTTSRSKQSNPVWKVLIPVGVLLTLILGALMLIRLQVSQTPGGADGVEIRQGNRLPDFTLTYLNGTTTPVSKISAKVMMINFWATWCEACMEEMPSIVKLRNTYQSRGFEVLGVNLDEDPVT